jgi:hypothetical protein
MQHLLITIADSANLASLKTSLMKMEGIKSVEVQPPLSSEDWARPGRPATDEEIRLSADEAEQSTYFLFVDEARTRTHERFNSKWK